MPHEIDYLITGYQHFRRRYFDGSNSLFDNLVKHGQQPKVLMVACSDSRVDPSIILDCQPGDLFMVRNVANLIPPYENNASYHGTSAALEFGIKQLNIRHIILFGHSGCGGIKALLENKNMPGDGFISKWTEIAEPAREKVLKEHHHLPESEQVNLCSQYALIHSLENLLTFPWISEKVKANVLFLHAWHFELSSGKILAYNSQNGLFEEISFSSF